jgi:hypothetical protein
MVAMKRHIWGSILAVCVLSAMSAAQKICIGAPGGSDAVTFNIQQPLYKALADELKARGQTGDLQLLASNYEKSVRKEASGYKCEYAIVTDLSREWPTPKDDKGGGATLGGKKDDDNAHPPSTSHWHFHILDKDGKRVDKFETEIEMQPGFTAANVKDKVQEIIQQVANLAADYVTPQK